MYAIMIIGGSMKKKHLILLFSFLCVSLLSISIGFSALSTSLSINGHAAFTPVAMIRVLSFELAQSSNTTESSYSHTPDTINALLDINSLDGYATYNVKISNLGEVDEELSQIEPLIFSNENMEYEINGLNLGDVIKAKEEVNFTITFKYKNGATLNDKHLNAKIKFHFEEYHEVILPTYSYIAEGECIFSGKNNLLVGNCADGNTDFVNTNIHPFNDENYQKNFVLKFTIKSVDANRFGAGKRDTMFNILYESDDKIYGKYPGVLLRIEGTKWQLQGGDGNTSANKIQFAKNDLIGKEIKIIRHNDNGTIKLYYMIGDNDPILLKDMTNLKHTFDTPLTFGANVDIDGVTPDRYAYATLEDLAFGFYEDGLTLSQLIGREDPPNPPDPIDPDPPIFNVTGPCIFNGQNTNITGDNCSTYSNINYINSGIYLYNSENYEKDFDVSFTIDSYTNSNQEVAQVTLVNAFLERKTGKGYGFLLRRANTGLSLIIRDGNGAEKEVTIQENSISSFRIIRKNKKICYSINNGPFVFAISNANFNAPFDVPITFGGSIDSSGNPFRYIKGTLSNIKITIGTIDPNITCE